MIWIPANIFYPLLSTFSGLKQAGELKALMNFAAPVLQTYAALSSLLLPYVSRRLGLECGQGVNLSALTRRITALYAAGALAYWVPVLLLKAPFFRLLYSGKYTEVAYLLSVVALGSVAWSAFSGPAPSVSRSAGARAE